MPKLHTIPARDEGIPGSFTLRFLLSISLTILSRLRYQVQWAVK